jgi:isoquinoline 1-oxidoreductase alpha subunit
MSYTLTVNGATTTVDAAPGTPLLWVVRDHLNLTGTKFGCGVAACGSCTVHLDGVAVRACQTPVEDAAGAAVTTIEGLSGPVAAAVQAAWQGLNVVQCGYCQSGQIMQAVDLLSRTPRPADADIDAAMAGNACRCATYPRIRAAIHAASATLEG